MKVKHKNKQNKFIFYTLLLIGFSILSYPLISRVYYDYQGSDEIQHYQENLNELSDQEKEEMIALAYAYNNALLSGEQMPLADPFSEEEKEEGVSHYAEMVEIHEKIGVLTIPTLHMKFPVYAGVSESVLQKGVGHLEGTSLPIGGLNTHSVVTAHRGLPQNKLFTDLDKMAIDDIFFFESIVGTLAYKVVETKVIEPTDIHELVIEKDKDKLTLLTCTPYMVNSHRLLVIGERTELPTDEQEELTEITWWRHLLSLLREYIWVLLALVIFLIIKKIRKRKSDQIEN